MWKVKTGYVMLQVYFCVQCSSTEMSVSTCCGYNSPRSVLLLFSLHHVTQTSIGESLSEVSVRCHEAVVVEAGSQAG